jgi:uncharacterized protein YeaO (DUF488 family)
VIFTRGRTVRRIRSARPRIETEEGAAALAELRDVLRGGPVTLVTAARHVDGRHVAVLVRLLS